MKHGCTCSLQFIAYMDRSSNSQPRKRTNKENSQKQAPTSRVKPLGTVLLDHKRCLERIEQQLRPNNLHRIGTSIVESFRDDLNDIYVELRKIETSGIAL